MKVIFQLIGFLVVILLLLTAVLFYLDSKGLLSGDLGSLIHALHQLYLEARDVTLAFLQRSGIADDAADLLDEGADRLRGQTATDSPTIIEMATPEFVNTPLPETTTVPGVIRTTVPAIIETPLHGMP